MSATHVLAGADLGADFALGGGNDTFASGIIGGVLSAINPKAAIQHRRCAML